METIRRNKGSNRESEGPVLNALLNHPEVGVYTSALTGRFLETNRKFCEMTGYTAGELSNKSLKEILFPEDTDVFLQGNQMLPSQGEEHYSFEKKVIKKDHSVIWLSFIISLIYMADGTPHQYIGIVQDITLRKNKEQVYNETEMLLDSIFNTTNAMIAYLDRDFNFIRVNKLYAEAGGYPSEYYIGKNHFDLYPYEDNEAIFRRVVEKGKPISYYAKPFEYKDFPELGVTYWDWDLIPVKNASGYVTGLVFSLVDVTKRKLAEDEIRKTNDWLEKRVLERTAELQGEIAQRKKIEQALRQSEQRYREVFENTSDGIILVDVVSVDRFRIVDFNASIERILGFKSLDVIGESIDQVLTKDSTALLSTNFSKCVELGSILSYEECMSIFSTDTYIYATLIPILDEGGKIYRILGVCRDITDQKRMAESLKRAKEEAEFASNAKSEYISNMSHELRTPLNVILSAIQLFELYLKDRPSSGDDKYFHYLKSMKQNCLRLLRLVNNLIDTTKIDANFYDVNLGHYDIVNIVEVITLSVTDYVKNRGIELSYTSNIDEKIIACDIDIIERIMLNLLSNAIKFTDANGTIKVSLIDQGDNIVISVKDNGIGIPKGKQKVIFERYKQADQLLTRRHEGSGIGLSLTKSFVEVLGGKISARSEVGFGSEFIVELPCKTIPAKEGKAHIKYTLNDYSIIQKITVELSDIYTLKE